MDTCFIHHLAHKSNVVFSHKQICICNISLLQYCTYFLFDFSFVYKLVFLHASYIPKSIIERHSIRLNPVPHNFRICYIGALSMTAFAKQNDVCRLVLSSKRIWYDMATLKISFATTTPAMCVCFAPIYTYTAFVYTVTPIIHRLRNSCANRFSLWHSVPLSNTLHMKLIFCPVFKMIDVVRG